jgi:phage recombination protein Bet
MNKAAEATEVAVRTDRKVTLVGTMASKLGIEPANLMKTLKATAFKPPKIDGKYQEVTDEQMMALLIVANEHGLNPFTREIFAFPDKHNGIVPVVSVDGWIRIINDHPQFNGVKFELDWTEGNESCTCTIWRKDRDHPIVVTEYLAECYRNVGAWLTHKRRFLRHKSLIQCARVAFGFAGIYDPDEAQRIREGEIIDITPDAPKNEAETLNIQLGLSTTYDDGSAPVGPDGGRGSLGTKPTTREPGEDDDEDGNA